MQWQSYPTLINRYRLSQRIRATSIAFLAVGSGSLALGWINLYFTLAIGADARVPMLDLADEQIALINILQPVAMFYASLLCFVASRLSSTSVNRRAFGFLSVGFLILAAGEININSHSIYIDRMHSLLGNNSQVALTLLPLLLVPIGAALLLRHFLIQLPRRHAFAFIAFGMIYVSGVLGAEMVWEWIAPYYGHSFSAYSVTAGVEETLETVGLLGFCVAMSRYIEESCPKVFLDHPENVLNND